MEIQLLNEKGGELAWLRETYEGLMHRTPVDDSELVRFREWLGSIIIVHVFLCNNVNLW